MSLCQCLLLDINQHVRPCVQSPAVDCDRKHSSKLKLPRSSAKYYNNDNIHLWPRISAHQSPKMKLTIRTPNMLPFRARHGAYITSCGKYVIPNFRWHAMPLSASGVSMGFVLTNPTPPSTQIQKRPLRNGTDSSRINKRPSQTTPYSGSFPHDLRTI